jgi:hypothetical protein
MAAHALPATADRVGGRLAMVDHMVRPAMVEADIPVRRVVDIHRAVAVEADTPRVVAVDTPAVAADIPVVVITKTPGELMYELM